jgi:hypothetical protein
MNPFIPKAIHELLAKPVSYYKHQGTEAVPAEPLTNVAFVLDRSGSMAQGIESTIEGYNEQIRSVREGAKGIGHTTYTSVQFASTVDIRSVAGAVDSITYLTEETYQPSGNTALLDAVGSTIAALLDTAHIHGSQTANLVTVFTDGEENASRIYTASMVKGLIERLEATDHWTFALVGPLSSVRGLAESLSIQQGNTLGYDESSATEKRRAFARAAVATDVMFSRKLEGFTKAENLFR